MQTQERSKAPSSAAIGLLQCLECRSPMQVSPDPDAELCCTECNHTRRIDAGVVRFLDDTDDFYEGAYARQIRYLPGQSRLRDWAFFNLVQSGVLGQIKRVLPESGGVLLDLGCAGGIRWLGRDALTIGVDLSMESLRLAADTYAAALQASVLELPIADEQVDVVYSSYLFEHLTKDNKRAALKEIARVLRPGGGIVLQFDTLSNNALTRYALHDPAAFKRGFIDNDGHVGLAPLSSTLELFEPLGLNVVEDIRFGTTPLQYMATYSWLNSAYGDDVSWVRALGAVANKVSTSKLAIPYEMSVTAIDTLLSPFADRDKATRAIVVARKG